MNVYLDTSVVLSRLLKQSNALLSWGRWEAAYTSVLTRLEFLRTVDRMRLAGTLDDRERVALQERFSELWQALHRVALSPPMLDRAGAPMPTVLGTLDAIHLVTALHVRDVLHVPLVFLTHDVQLATAVRAMGLPVSGA